MSLPLRGILLFILILRAPPHKESQIRGDGHAGAFRALRHDKSGWGARIGEENGNVIPDRWKA